MANTIDKPSRSDRVMPYVYSPLQRRAVFEYFVFGEEIARLTRRIAELESKIAQEKVIMLREITREEAKGEIRQLFTSGRTLYYSDIVQELGIDLEMVVDICEELENEKEIGVDAGVS